MTQQPHYSRSSPSSSPLLALYDKVVAKTSNDPYAFVMSVFPWGEPSSPLFNKHPYKWQIDIMMQIKVGLTLEEVVSLAVASGHRCR